MKIKRKIIEIDEERCNGCGQCVIACAEGAIEIVDGKAKVISDNLCDGLGACLGECPEDALRIIEREAEDFDEEAVERHLAEREKSQGKQSAMASGCPSTRIQQFEAPAGGCQKANQPSTIAPLQSELTNWPVQITLVPPSAPFLKNADLLVAADCVPFAFAGFHAELLKGKILMMGCPKLDQAQAYIDKFAEIFKSAGIRSLTCAVMEVPCCSGLPVILKKGMEAAGVDIPMQVVVVSTKGEVVETRQV